MSPFDGINFIDYYSDFSRRFNRHLPLPTSSEPFHPYCVYIATKGESMKQTKYHLPALILIVLLAACSPALTPQTGQTPPPAPMTEPTSVPVDSEMPVPPTDGEPATPVPEMIVADTLSHTDETYAYTFDYPIEWMLDPSPSAHAPPAVIN
jgi:hypothetical protein